MPEAICKTSPLQYLHQIGLLHIIPGLVGRVWTPPAVVAELAAGRERGVNLPDPSGLAWITVRSPLGQPVLPLVTDLGPGETEVLALGLENAGSILILDDRLARRVAETLNLKFRGTLGLLLDAKDAGMIESVLPAIDLLQSLGFRLAPATRTAVLRLAGEGP